MADPAKVTGKWNRNLTGATQTIKDGVAAMTVNPMEEAAKQKDRYKDGVQKAVDEGRWERGLRSVSVDDWKTKMTTVGVNRISDGAKAAQQKVMDFHAKFQPIMERAKAQIKTMPKGTEQASLDRVKAAMDAAKSYRK